MGFIQNHNPLKLSDDEVVTMLESSLEGSKLLIPGSEEYSKKVKRWSDASEKPAGAILLVSSIADIATAVTFAQTWSLDLAVCGGGHSTSGASSSDGGLVIDLSHMRGVTVDKEAKTITAQGGCTWEDVDKAGYEHGLVTVGGTVNHTGIGGLTLGGGYGWLSGEYGLVIDNLLSVQIVLADGSTVTASNSENTDLFWAVCGAGQGFGVVVEFTYRAYEQTSTVWAGQMVFLPNDLDTLVTTVNDLHAKAKGNSGMVLGFVRPPPAFLPVAVVFLYFNGAATEAEGFYAPLIALKPVMNSCASMAYPKLNSMINFAVGHGDRKTSKGATFTTPIRPAFFHSIFDEYANFIEQNPSIFCTLLFEYLPSEKICAVSNDATAFANRGDHQNTLISPKWKDPAQDEKCKVWATELAGKFKEEKERGKREGDSRMKHEGSGQYGNYDGLNEKGQIIFAANYPRLQELKRKFDAHNIFNKSHVQIDTSVKQVESGIVQLSV